MTRERTDKPFLGTLPGLILGCLISCGLWGSAYPCVKIGYELFGIAGSDVASRLVFAGTRFTIAGIMVVVGVSIAQRRALLPARRDLGAIAILALFQTVLQYFFFYGGLSHAAGVTSSIIGAAAYFFAILFAALIFKTARGSSCSAALPEQSPPVLSPSSDARTTQSCSQAGSSSREASYCLGADLPWAGTSSPPHLPRQLPSSSTWDLSRPWHTPSGRGSSPQTP